MIITLKPSDIIKRCLWLEYKKFCLKGLTDDEIVNVVKNDEMIILSEEDAYVIGLLKIIETDNLIHRFEQDIEEFLKIKSIINQGKLYVYKVSIIKEILQFKDRFPSCYNPPFEYKKSIDDLFDYIDKFYSKISGLEEYEIMVKDNKSVTCYPSNNIKKLLFK
jgi:hypothetical protein